MEGQGCGLDWMGVGEERRERERIKTNSQCHVNLPHSPTNVREEGVCDLAVGRALVKPQGVAASVGDVDVGQRDVVAVLVVDASRGEVVGTLGVAGARKAGGQVGGRVLNGHVAHGDVADIVALDGLCQVCSVDGALEKGGGWEWEVGA